MVVFEDGLARKSEYRRFIVRGPRPGGAAAPVTAPEGAPVVDDTAAMREVLTRRFQRYLEERDSASDLELGPDDEGAPARVDPDTGRPKRFAYPPNLVVVDGGLPQVNAAAAALGDLGVDDVAVVGLAKRLEEVWVPGQDFPVILPRTSEGLYLLQRVRDEAHRFAITFHRQRRSKAMTASALDGVPGLGAAKRKALLSHFGSVKKIRAASEEELQAVPGIGPALAATLAAQLSQEGTAAPAVNLMTGEVIDDEEARRG
jgi:excinuclease ABC subunit C